MKLALGDLYNDAYAAEIVFLREAVEHTVVEILRRHVLDADGIVRPEPPLRQTGSLPERTARGFRRKVLDYGVARGHLVAAADGALRACVWPLPPVPAPPVPEGHRRTMADLLASIVRVSPAVMEGVDGFAALESDMGLKAMFELWEWLMVEFPPKRPCNVLLARVLDAALRESPRPLRVLEGGAGVGAVLRHAFAAPEIRERLEMRLESFLFTDISAVLLDRGRAWLRRNAAPDLFARFKFERLDLDELPQLGAPYDQEGLFDLILLEHVLYDVRDLGATLRRFRRLLAPGGHLAFTMSFRSMPYRFLACEILQSTLHSYNRAELDPPRRPNAGYLFLSDWRLSLEDAGFTVWEPFPAPADHDRWPFGGIVATRA